MDSYKPSQPKYSHGAQRGSGSGEHSPGFGQSGAPSLARAREPWSVELGVSEDYYGWRNRALYGDISSRNEVSPNAQIKRSSDSGTSNQEFYGFETQPTNRMSEVGERARAQADSLTRNGLRDSEYYSEEVGQGVTSSGKISDVLGGREWHTTDNISSREYLPRDSTVSLNREVMEGLNPFLPTHGSSLILDPNSMNQWRPEENEIIGNESQRRVTFAEPAGMGSQTPIAEQTPQANGDIDPISRLAELLLYNLGNPESRRIDQQRFPNFAGLITEDPIGFLRKIVAEFYGRVQGDSEKVDLFIAEKLALASRLLPEMKEDEVIRLIVQLISPSIKPYLSGREIHNIEELMHLAGGIGTDLSLVRSNTRSNNSERMHATPAVANNTYSREANTYWPPMLRENNRGMPDRQNNFATLPGNAAKSREFPWKCAPHEPEKFGKRSAGRPSSSGEPSRAMNIGRSGYSGAFLANMREQPPVENTLEGVRGVIVADNELDDEVLVSLSETRSNVRQLPVNGRAVLASVDTWASVNFVRPDILNNIELCNLPNPSTVFLGCAYNTSPSLGHLEVFFDIDGLPFTNKFTVLSTINKELILGMPFLTASEALIDAGRKCSYFGSASRQTVFWDQMA
ncbi:hypothetical protein JTB14_013892 [Gonioctena quinquepunctata]|nr:hypothetical protein JTB14_013892 [Gonioctena quinquepunctata]